MGSPQSKPPIDPDTTPARPEEVQEKPLQKIQGHLREKYLSEIETIQRRVAGDPEAWTDEKFDEAKREIDELRNVLLLTDSLDLKEEGEENQESLGDFTACPICLEDLVPPLQIFTCSQGHAICSVCLKNLCVKCCAECREDFGPGRPSRNKFAERLILKIIGE